MLREIKKRQYRTSTPKMAMAFPAMQHFQRKSVSEQKFSKTENKPPAITMYGTIRWTTFMTIRYINRF